MKRPRVLVVDDEPGILHAVERVLERQCEVISCRTSANALAACETSDLDLAVVDVRMPDIDGFGLLARLKKAHPGLDVILMTGSVNELDRQLARSVREKAFFFLQKPFERELLLSVFDRWRELKALAEKNREYTERLERDLRDAQDFQRAMLPPDQAELEGVALHARFIPCEEVSGDFYDYAPAGRGRVAMVMSDVAGHGVAAAMQSGFIKSAFQAAHVDDYAPLSVLHRVRAALASTDAERFVTLICIRICVPDRRLEYVSAGHPDGVLWSPAGDVRHLAPTGPLVTSAFAHASWEQRAVDISPGAQLLLHTDGIEEGRSDDDLFGHERLLREITAGERRGFELLDGILAAASAFTASRPIADDYTMLLARMTN